MEDLSDDFLDRTEAINNFRSLINHQRHRLLLIYGPAGQGKTYLQHELWRISRDEQIVSAIVDFQLPGMGTEPYDVITFLSECLGDPFAAR
jgi:Cdc6-like AAA superfamily ATPase